MTHIAYQVLYSPPASRQALALRPSRRQLPLHPGTACLPLASCGQALELLRSRKYLPDLVLLDVQMPNRTGYEVRGGGRRGETRCGDKEMR